MTSGASLRRLVAIKRVHRGLVREARFRAMLIDEANVAARLTHANIAQIYELGDVDDQCFIAMEYIHGRDLRSIFRRYADQSQAVPLAQACYIGMKLCDGLDYVHNRKDYCGRDLNLVHRDISLNNVILSFDGELKIVDFGIAKSAMATNQTGRGHIKGKLLYMSPEQLRAQPVDCRSDIFACGVVLFELCTGQRLFHAPDTSELLRKLRNAEVPRPSALNPAIPKRLDDVICEALERDPDRRYQTAAALRDALAEVVQAHDLHVSRSHIAAWMKARYARDYQRETSHIASLWASAMDRAGREAGDRAVTERSLVASSIDRIPATGQAASVTAPAQRARLSSVIAHTIRDPRPSPVMSSDLTCVTRTLDASRLPLDPRALAFPAFPCPAPE